MKTTLDLPDDLVREIKIQAIHDGSKLKETVARLLRLGLQMNQSSAAAKGKRQPLKLPLFPTSTEAPASRLSVADLAALSHQTLLDADCERQPL